ncbi:(Trans)glycosidase [Glarea lozoyensis ATCC 20868]|uniref:chitinase n=1 Tax=Glarea lozoyensis (strain ATCC 20868 / MF5171) TaxID=1116229 RepID=S3D4T9_GLAL2|nr:(Trans)glycosidase [Glarea lozoyensis ATCC 20868]EPE32780.1 (Trans)glycosidase [Glarea lozoyensis ATCC 20868]
MLSIPSLSLLSSFLFCIEWVRAGFDPAASNNVADKIPTAKEMDLCLSKDFLIIAQLNIIPIAFLTTLHNPSINLANSEGGCTAIPGSSLLYCSQVEEDIQTCQKQYGKTILLSIGGANYIDGGFPSPEAAVAAANNIWSIFGPKTVGSTASRPFGNAAVDGFDFDFEMTCPNMVAFANQLRKSMDACTAGGEKKFYLTTTPQCPYPDGNVGPMLAGAVYFDAIFIQFFNNECGLPSYVPGSTTQTIFNFETWDKWAKTESLNKNVKIFLGIPGSSTAAGSGYMSGGSLEAIIGYTKTFSSFGGVMIWDMSQVFANNGFLNGVTKCLSLPAGPGTTMVTSVKPASTQMEEMMPPYSSQAPSSSVVPVHDTMSVEHQTSTGTMTRTTTHEEQPKPTSAIPTQTNTQTSTNTSTVFETIDNVPHYLPPDKPTETASNEEYHGTSSTSTYTQTRTYTQTSMETQTKTTKSTPEYLVPSSSTESTTNVPQYPPIQTLSTAEQLTHPATNALQYTPHSSPPQGTKSVDPYTPIQISNTDEQHT